MKEKLEERKLNRILEIVQQEALVKNLQSQLLSAETTLISMRGGVIELNTLINDIEKEEQHEVVIPKQKPEKELKQEPPKKDKIIKKKKTT